MLRAGRVQPALPACTMLGGQKRFAGHSKWSKIKHSKGAADVKKGTLFANLSKDITAAAKEGGSDPAFNLRLAATMKHAKNVDMPKDTIERAIKRATSKEYSSAEAIVYEGLGPHGTALVIECLTDNKNRTVKAIRNKFNKNGGAMAPVSYMFDRKGLIWFSSGEAEDSLDEMFDKAIEAGAEDIEDLGDGKVEVVCEFSELQTVSKALTGDHKYAVERMEGTYIPNTTVDLSEEQTAEVESAIEDLESLDDVIK
ncbi:hypothetical protein EC988_000203, partial [Linderina pennispora]